MTRVTLVKGKSKPSNSETFRAGALLCPTCCVEYVEAQVDFEVDGKVIHNVKLLRCPLCQEEAFTPEQQAAIKEKVKDQ